MPFPPGNIPTDPDSVPLLDEWGWADYWSASDWLTWHAAVKARYGLEVANRKFIQFWEQQGFGANPINARTFNAAFRAYARENGFFDSLFYGIGSLAKPLGTVASDLPAVIDTTGNILRVIAPVVIVGALILYVIPPLLRKVPQPAA